ncbi:MAG: AraC family transcriptional regulator [Saprospiraceae bacterium]|nr:AraC family transcriptional regulator [Saprospiraceae bacterium]
MAFAIEEPAFDPYWHYHPEIELTLIIHGSGIRFVGDSIESYQRGDLVLIGERLPHHWVSKDHSKTSLQKAVVVQFQWQWLQNLAELQGLAAFIRSAKSGVHFPDVKAETEVKIQSLLDLPPPLRVSRLIEILFDLSKDYTPRALSQNTQFHLLDSAGEQERINQLITYIMDNLDQQLGVGDVADFCFMVPQAFCRWFRRHTGFSFITYLNKTRIEAACQYLLTSELAVKQIAYQVGFGNVSHFNRTFKKYVGTSPLGFKRQYLDRNRNLERPNFKAR